MSVCVQLLRFIVWHVMPLNNHTVNAFVSHLSRQCPTHTVSRRLQIYAVGILGILLYKKRCEHINIIKLCERLERVASVVLLDYFRSVHYIGVGGERHPKNMKHAWLTFCTIGHGWVPPQKNRSMRDNFLFFKHFFSSDSPFFSYFFMDAFSISITFFNIFSRNFILPKKFIL